MTETKRKAWVGDQVYDSSADKEGVVTDVSNGTYVLRPVHRHWGGTWTAPSAEGLKVTVSREERIRRHRDEL